MAENRTIQATDLFCSNFFQPHNDIYDELYREYWFMGGRGSCKSTFCSLEVVIGVMTHPDAHACCLRKTGSTCRSSVFKQIEWAINRLGVRHLWEPNYTELKWVYTPTKQEIVFRGLDDPEKLKSLKQPFGYYRYLWFEELTEFSNMKEVRSVMQTILRGGRKFQCFFSYNPPASASSWVNVESLAKIKGRVCYKSDYRIIQKEHPEWLGKEFFEMAEALKAQDEKAYRHEYLGEVTGTGGQFFNNVEVITMDDWKTRFGIFQYGVDFGKNDPNVFVVTHYDADRRYLYILGAIYRRQLTVRRFAKMIEKFNSFPEYVVCDCADTTAIDILNEHEINAISCIKGHGSIQRGLSWLRDKVEKIFIVDDGSDDMQAVITEFLQYEYKQDRYGNWTEEGSDKNNHSIDAVRYAQEENIRAGGIGS